MRLLTSYPQWPAGAMVMITSNETAHDCLAWQTPSEARWNVWAPVQQAREADKLALCKALRISGYAFDQRKGEYSC